jgi:hypothetical protein
MREENRRCRSVEARVPGWIFGVRRGVDERQPRRIGFGARVAVVSGQRNRGDGTPGDLGGDGAVEALGGPTW